MTTASTASGTARPAMAMSPAGRPDAAPDARAIWMCSGQGSQFFQMGKDALEGDRVFRQAMEWCCDFVRPMLGISLLDEIYRPRANRFDPFDRLLYSNPAVVALQYSTARLLASRRLVPDLTVGYSIGEVSAAVISGVVSIEDALTLSVMLARLVEERLPEGGMLAVLSERALVDASPEWFQGTSVAADNFPGHFVVAGDADAIRATERLLTARRIAVQRLPVRYAFHSAQIDPIRGEFVSQAAALVGHELAESFWEAIRRPVDFRTTVAGLELGAGDDCIDLGPAGTLASFVKYNLGAGSPVRIHNTVTPFDRTLQNVESLCSAVGSTRLPGATSAEAGTAEQS